MTDHTKAREPHPIADIICAWANGFRVEFRYRHRDHNEDSETVYCSDEKWYLCGKHYAAFSSVNEHRVHADDLAAWEAFKRPAADQSLTVGDEPEDEKGLALWQLIYGAIAHEPLPLKVAQIEAAAKRVEDMLKRRAALAPAAQAEPVAWRIRIGGSDAWSYCEREADADFYGKQSGLNYVKEALARAASNPPAQGLGGKEG